MKQPLVAVALFYAAGVVLAHFIEAPLSAAFIVGFLIVLGGIVFGKARPLILPASLFLLGWLNMTTRTAIISPHDLRSLWQEQAKLVSVRGRIVGAPSQRIFLRNDVESSHTLAEIAVSATRESRSDWQPAFSHVMSRTEGVLPAEFVDGQMVEVTGVALQPLPPIAEGAFDY